jgi:hypothetical protein
MMHTVIVAGALFVLAHFAMLIGVTTPEKFYFDEVHYVPAARQMLAPTMSQPIDMSLIVPDRARFRCGEIITSGAGRALYLVTVAAECVQ